jgi:hypothetical protein
MKTADKYTKYAGFWPGFWAGLSGTTIGNLRDFTIQPRASDLDAMRSDWERIGRDFHVVIDRENGKAPA